LFDPPDEKKGEKKKKEAAERISNPLASKVLQESSHRKHPFGVYAAVFPNQRIS